MYISILIIKVIIGSFRSVLHYREYSPGYPPRKRLLVIGKHCIKFSLYQWIYRIASVLFIDRYKQCILDPLSILKHPFGWGSLFVYLVCNLFYLDCISASLKIQYQTIAIFTSILLLQLNPVISKSQGNGEK